jgi:hypothetical protein
VRVATLRIIGRDDEICFHLFEGASADAVRRATERAALRCTRIVGACELAATRVDPGRHDG